MGTADTAFRDTHTVASCQNPPGWWSVLVNGQPIHHWAIRENAEAHVELLDAGLGREAALAQVQGGA